MWLKATIFIRQYSSRLSNLFYWHFLSLVPTSFFLWHTSLWILSPVPSSLSLGLFNWLQVGVQHLLGFLSGLPTVMTEIWNLISLPSFTPWINPHYVHTHKWTDIYTSYFVSEDSTLCSSPHERSRTALQMLDPLFAARACDMGHLHPNTFTEAENSRCVLAIWISRRKHPSSQDFLSSPRPNKLKLTDFSTLIDTCFLLAFSS